MMTANTKRPRKPDLLRKRASKSSLPRGCYSEGRPYMIHFAHGEPLEVNAATPGLAVDTAYQSGPFPMLPVVGVEDESGARLEVRGRCVVCRTWLLPHERSREIGIGTVCGDCLWN